MKSLHQETREYIDKYDLRLTKRFGQNFLVDPMVLSKIMTAGAFEKTDIVIEIGAGIGTLTKALAQDAGKVYTWEIDKRMIEPLKERLEDISNVEIIEGDFLDADLSFLETYKHIKVCANLPYYITSPIVMKILESNLSLDSLVIMVQKELGDRMVAKAGTPDYSSFSAVLSYYGEIEVVAKVSAQSFIPRPKVNSAVIKIKRYTKPPVLVADESLLFTIIHAAFSMRRKTILNCLSKSKELAISKDQGRSWLLRAGIEENRRGETLELKDFARLADTYINGALN